VAQEQLLQGRGLADQAAHPGRGQVPQHLVEAFGVDLAAHPRALHLQLMHPGEPGQAVRRAGQLGLDRGPGEVAQLGQGARLDGAPGPHDAHPVAQGLGLGQDVAGQQHRAPAVALVGDDLTEAGLHERVQPRGGLVEQQQLDVGGERGHQGDLLAVALGVGAGLLARVEVEQLQQLVPVPGVEATPEAAQQVDHLAAGQVRPQGHVPGDIGEAAVQGDRVAPGVAAEQLGPAGVGPQQAQQDPDGGGLAGPVGAEEPVYLAGPHLQVEPVEGPGGAEALHQSRDRDRGVHRDVIASSGDGLALVCRPRYTYFTDL
jgi:hypothetical protein